MNNPFWWKCFLKIDMIDAGHSYISIIKMRQKREGGKQKLNFEKWLRSKGIQLDIIANAMQFTISCHHMVKRAKNYSAHQFGWLWFLQNILPLQAQRLLLDCLLALWAWNPIFIQFNSVMFYGKVMNQSRSSKQNQINHFIINWFFFNW